MKQHQSLFAINEEYRFAVIPHWIEWFEYQNGTKDYKQLSLIGIKDTKYGVEIIHPLSSFILSNWLNFKYNTQKKNATIIVNFLNFLLENKFKYKINSLYDLDFRMGTDFLNTLTYGQRSRTTITDNEKSLIKFYLFLSSNNVIPYIAEESVKIKTVNDKFIYNSPFKGVIYPEIEQLKKVEHYFPVEYIPIFLEVANMIAKPIVLGIYLQIFGGLRIGEATNIRRSQIKHSLNKEQLLLNIKNQNFRMDIKGHNSSNVKKKRHQEVYNINDWFSILFYEHLELFKDRDKSGALFVNRNFKAMTTDSYRQYFNKVRKYFIKLLLKYGDAQDRTLAKSLNSKKWSSHIGRGTFSNILAEISDNPAQLAYARGDANMESSLTYISKTSKTAQKIERAFFHMHHNYIPSLIEETENENGDENG